jgi:hypothetical protein
MTLDELWKALEQSELGSAIAEGSLWFPWLEAVHVLAITLVVGSIAIVDLRLLGWASRDRPLAQLIGEVVPCTWTAFAVAAVTGALLFISKAPVYAHNFFFLGKMALLGMCGLNVVFFYNLPVKNIARWGTSLETTPFAAKVAGAVSLILWISVVAFGRWIGFTT